MKEALYFGIGTAADGWVIGVNSLRSIALVAGTAQQHELDSFSVNILPEGEEDPKAVEGWKRFELWESITANAIPAKDAMLKLYAWMKSFENAEPIGIVDNATLVNSGMWLQHYLQRYHGKNPFGMNWLDLRSYFAGRAKTNWKYASIPTGAKREGYGRSRAPLEVARDRLGVVIRSGYGTPMPAPVRQALRRIDDPLRTIVEDDIQAQLQPPIQTIRRNTPNPDPAWTAEPQARLRRAARPQWEDAVNAVFNQPAFVTYETDPTQ